MQTSYILKWDQAVCRQQLHLWYPRNYHILSPTVPESTIPLDPQNHSYLLPAEYQCHYKLQRKWDRVSKWRHTHMEVVSVANSGSYYRNHHWSVAGEGDFIIYILCMCKAVTLVSIYPLHTILSWVKILKVADSICIVATILYKNSQGH